MRPDEDIAPYSSSMEVFFSSSLTPPPLLLLLSVPPNDEDDEDEDDMARDEGFKNDGLLLTLEEGDIMPPFVLPLLAVVE